MSQDQDRNIAYRKQRNEMRLLVPNYSCSDRNLQFHSLNDVEKRSRPSNINEKLIGEAYNSPENSNSPSSNTTRLLDDFALISNYQPEFLNHGYNYRETYTNAFNSMQTSELVLQPPSEMPRKHQLYPHLTGHDEIMKKGLTGPKVPPSTQIEEYRKKAALLREELETLRDQRNELRGDGTRSPSPETSIFLKENTKLQLDVQNKLRTLNNILELVNGIVGDHATEDHATEDHATEPRKQPAKNSKHKQQWTQKFNYVFYDPEMHWCRVCNVFPQTAKDYLSHLHSPDHERTAVEHAEAPWHSVSGLNEGYPSLPTAPTKRTPIRGLQFFVPATAWYCKLCDQFIGDLHCASAHIKSILHSKNYNKFVQQNPHWETDWMSDRQRAFERSRAESKLDAVDDVACLKQKVKYVTHTVTISKDTRNKAPKTSPVESEDGRRCMDKRKLSRGSSLSSMDVSGSDSEDASDKDKKLKSKEMVDSEKMNYIDSATRKIKLTDEDRKLLENIKNRMKNNGDRKRSSSRDRERTRDILLRIREKERRGRLRDRRDRSSDSHHNRNNNYCRDRSTDRSRDRSNNRTRDRSNNRTRDRSTNRDRSNNRTRDRSTDRNRIQSRDRLDRRSSRDRRAASRDRRDKSRDRRDGSRDHKVVSPSRRDNSKERHDDAQEPPVSCDQSPVPLMSLSLSMPPLPPPLSLEYQEAMGRYLPLHPTKRAEMFNVMQQPGILGPPPGPPLRFPFGYPGGMFPPGMFSHGMFSPLSVSHLPRSQIKHNNIKLEQKQAKTQNQRTELQNQRSQPRNLPTELQSQPVDLQSQLTQPHSQPTELETQLTQLESHSTELQSQPTAPQSQPINHKIQFTQSRSYPTELEIHLTQSQSQPTEVQNQPTQPESQLTDVQSQPNELETQLTRPKSQRIELSNQPTELEIHLTRPHTQPTDAQDLSTQLQSHPTELKSHRTQPHEWRERKATDAAAKSIESTAKPNKTRNNSAAK